MLSYFAHIAGNEHIKQYLVRMVGKNAVANSLLFAGPDGIGKSLFAAAFAKLLLCANDPEGINRRKIDAGTHPDIREYRPEGKIGMHSIDALRQFGEEVYLSPYEGQWKVFIVHDADRMLTYSANALLKTFEEPAPRSIIILLSSKPEALLTTVLSRCRTIRFHSLADTEISQLLQEKWQKTPDEANLLAALAHGSMGHACRMVEQGEDQTRDRLLKILAQGKLPSYAKLLETAAEISSQLEANKQAVEEETRQGLLKVYPNDLTSVQKQLIDKEVDGVVAMRLANDAKVVFDIILSWYRDMHLLQVNGEKSHLYHPDYRNALEQACQRGEFLPLGTVQKAISQAKLALERSTPLDHCLENLFLQLHLF